MGDLLKYVKYSITNYSQLSPMLKTTTELDSVHDVQKGLDNNFDSLPRNSSAYHSISSDKRKTAPKVIKTNKNLKYQKDSKFL